jgi:6-phosphogluconolactonase (cycloisomerase 2 family)
MKQIILFIFLSVGLGLSNKSWAQAPKITSFTPTSGAVGATVTLTGTGFNTTPANNIVFFGATRATVTAATATSLTVTVPTGATYGAITVLNTGTSLAAYSTQFFTPTFSPNKESITTADIAAKVDFTTGTNPFSVAIGDLDGDGKPDLAVANYSSNTVSVYRNTSTSGLIAAGSFAAKVDFTTGTNPYSVAIGDLDGDGKPDLAVANLSSNTVSVYRNTSTSGLIAAGSFAAKVDFATGTNPYSVAIGDLDGDGKPDLAVANSGSNTVSVFRNTSTSGLIAAGSFAAKVDFTTGSGPLSVAIGDLDGDGKPDLAVANYGSASVSVFRNTSSSGLIAAGSFAAKVDFTTGSFPRSVAIGDLDGDGKPDLAVANYGSNTVSVLRNTSTSGLIAAGSFAAKVDFTTGTDPYSVAIGDLDGDGKPDLAVANLSSNTVSVYRNNSTSGLIAAGSFAAKVDFTTGSNPNSVAIGDLDGDGKPDLAVTNYGSATVSVYRNNPVFPPPTITSFTPTSGAVGATVTITGTSFNTTPANNIVFFGATRATVTAATATSLTVTVPTGATYGAITVLNTATSLAAYSTQFFNPTFTPNKGSITTSDLEAKVDFTTGTGPVSVAIGDLDGDGKPDLVVANEFSNTVSVYRNTSSSGLIAADSFAAKVDFTTGTFPHSVAIGDLDGDGKPDLAVANYSSARVSVLHNTRTSGSI